MQTRTVKKYTPEDHLTRLTQDWVGSILIMGSILFPVLGFMDIFVTPGNFVRFMIYRLIVGTLLIGLYFLSRMKRSRGYQYTIASVGAVLCAITVELAVLQSGGQNSTYYAAMIILTICCLGFAPINMPWSFFLVGLVYTIYVVPILMTEKIAGGVFISNNAFLISSFVIGMLLRYNNQKLIISELRLRAELSEDKRTFEAYSSSLKDQVAETSGALAITEQKYRALFDHANDGIAVLDRFGNITDVNHRFCELHGFDCDSLRGTSFRVLEIEQDRGEIDERLNRILSGESFMYEAEHYRRDGSRVLLEISSRAIDIGGVLHIQSFHRDITEKMRLREQALQSQKMESLGVLAGAIAHDFKNVLTGILAHTEVLRRHVTTDDFGKRRIKTIEDSARRAGQLISKLLSFSRKESLQLAPSDLNSVVTDTVELLGRALLEQNVKIKIMLDRDLPVVNGDDIQLEQVITNLVLNAKDAMAQGGTITISTGRRTLAPDSPLVAPFLKPGNYVVLSVSDTGAGIPREIIGRIFDPFFTTKEQGKGTGLGLAIVYGVVKSHRGEIRVESREGEGTVFEIFVPVLDRLPFSSLIREAPTAASERKQTIFLIDDDRDVLSSMQDALQTNGFKVFTADNSGTALELFELISGEIDLVIADIVMPVMNGSELMSVFKDRKPGLKVIGISGYKGGEIIRKLRSLDRFLKKPFHEEDFLDCVRTVLSSRRRDDAAEG